MVDGGLRQSTVAFSVVVTFLVIISEFFCLLPSFFCLSLAFSIFCCVSPGACALTLPLYCICHL